MVKNLKTYVINLKKRRDRKTHIFNEFEKYKNFDVVIFQAVENVVPAVGLYISLCSVIKQAKFENLPYVLFCEDDHSFTREFDYDELIDQIKLADNQCADVLLGGVSWYDYGTRLTKNLYWINSFTGMQFTIIFSRFYEKILSISFSQNDIIDGWISKFSKNIYLIAPFISVQKDFGYSDVTDKNNEVGILDKYFSDMCDRLRMLENVYDHINKIALPQISKEYYNDLQIPVYLIAKKNKARLASAIKQFENKNEFVVELMEINEITQIELWSKIKEIISFAKDQQDEIIIICNDDHEFTSNYSKDLLFQNILKGAYFGADLISGGSRNFDQIIMASHNLFWINLIDPSHFIIIYSRFYEAILFENFEPQDFVDIKLSELTNNKYLIYPFISIQKDSISSGFPNEGYASNIEVNSFEYTSERIKEIEGKMSLN